MDRRALRRDYRVTTDHEQGIDDVVLMTYREVVASYAVHPEAKSLGPDGTACGRATVGLLGRRPVTAARFAYIGKESNRLEDIEAGTVHDLEEVLTEYRDPDRDDWTEVILPVLREIPKVDLAAGAAIHPLKVAAIRNGHARPRSDHLAVLRHLAGAYARGRLREGGIKTPRNDLVACRVYLACTQSPTA